MKKIIAYTIMVLLITGIMSAAGPGNISWADEAEPAVPEIRTITLPLAENRDNTATIAAGNVYYLGQKGVVYQAPLSNPAEAKPVYQMPSGNDYSDDGFPIAWLITINETAILKYHIGGASMGTDYAVALHSDGSYEDLPGSYSNSVETDGATVILATDYRVLEFEIKRDNIITPLGEPGYSYGSYMLTNGETTAHMISSDLAVVDDEAYVVATKWNEASNAVEPVGIYQVNINTNETRRVFPETATHFKVMNGYIYFTDIEGFLYKAKLGMNEAAKVSDVKMNEFFIVGGDIYYTPYRAINGDAAVQELYRLGSSESLTSGYVLQYAPFDSNMNEEGMTCILYELDSYPPRFKGLVIDKSGRSTWIDFGDIQYVTVSNGVIYTVERADGRIKLNIDGRQVSFSEADGLGVPFIQNDNTMIPIRKPLEAIGADVSYDAANRTVLIKKDDTQISIVIGGGMFVNGSEFRQVVGPTAPATIKDGHVYVPIRHVFEVLGYSVSWDAETKTVNIKKTGPAIETVQGWSIPAYAAGAAGLGMTDYIGVLTEFPTDGQTISLNNQEQVDQIKIAGVGLRNFSNDKPVWLHSLTFEYQVFKKVNEREELVYQKSFLPFEGTLPAMTGTITKMEVDFWNSETATPGQYVIRLVYPEFFTGINKESNEAVSIPISQNVFGETAVINVIQ